MKIFDLGTLFKGKVTESILVESFDDYQKNGGTKDMFDVYSDIKSKAKKYESNYIQGMDMYLSGIPVKEGIVRKNQLLAEVFWTILHLWFNKPLRDVNYCNFSLDEFNSL